MDTKFYNNITTKLLKHQASTSYHITHNFIGIKKEVKRFYATWNLKSYLVPLQQVFNGDKDHIQFSKLYHK